MSDVQQTKATEHRVHQVLLCGVVLSSLLMAAGLVAAGLQHETFVAEPPPAWSALLSAAAHGHGPALVDLGLVVLMATPVVRVALLALVWLRDGQRRFALVAVVVLALLSLSVWLGLG